MLPENRIQSRENTANDHGADQETRCYLVHRSIDYHALFVMGLPGRSEAHSYHYQYDEPKGDRHAVQERIIREGAAGPGRQKL